MINYKVKDYEVNICQDIYEWGKEFYGVPDNATLENIEELTSTSMGFSMLDEKIIWIFIPQGNKKECYSSTIAHEVGHIIEGGFKKNPAPRMNKLHEVKAEHYENYFNLVTEIINTIQKDII